MHDFSVSEPDDMIFKVLADAANYLKKDREGIRSMCKAMEEMITDFVTDEKKMAAVRMLERGKLTRDEIAEYLDLPLSVIGELAEQVD